MRISLPLIALAVPLAACSGEDARSAALVEALPARGIRRLALVAVDSESVEPTTVKRLEVSASTTSTWEHTGELVDWVDQRDGAERVALALGRDGRLTIPAHLDASRFDQIAVRYMCKSPQDLRVELRDSEGRVSSAEARLGLHFRPATVLLDLPGAEGEYGELVLHFRGASTSELHEVGILGIDLVDDPLAGWLPSPDAPSLVRIGQTSRRAVGLVPGRTLSARFEPRRGERLELFFGQPRRIRRRERALVLDDRSGKRTLTITLSAGDEQAVSRFVLEMDGWQRASMDLAGWEGRDVSATFQLEVEADRSTVCAMSEPALVEDREGPQTVLLVTSDTHRWDHLGTTATGFELETPGLDALAARGVLFEQCFASFNLTNPSHAALMTGTHPRDTGVWDNQTALSEAAPTLAEAFAEAGFRTFGCVSVGHLDDVISGLGQGFDAMVAPVALDSWELDKRLVAELGAEEVERSLLGWLPESDGQPVFCWLHLYDAHYPYKPPPPFDRRYYDEQRDPFDPEYELAIDADHLHPGLEGLTDVAYPTAQYRAEITYLDDVLRRVLDLPRFRDGVVAMTADHGEDLGAHDAYWRHATLYTDTVHVPLILSWPGAPAGKRVTVPVRQIDLGRTLLDLAGVQAAHFQGRNLLDDAEPGPIFALSPLGNSAAIVQDGWYLLFVLREHELAPDLPIQQLHAVELYDLEADPGCNHDLADEEPERARALRRRLVRWLADARRDSWSGERTTDAEHVQQLAALGYADTGDGADASALWVDPECDCANCERFR